MDLARDGALRAELEAARAWGVSWRRFCGWEPARTTIYEYDDAGRLVRSITRVESEWDDLDRQAALTLAEFEADLCPGCRRPMAETTSPDHEFSYRAGHAIRCHRCTATARASEAYEDSPVSSALFIPIEFEGD